MRLTKKKKNQKIIAVQGLGSDMYLHIMEHKLVESAAIKPITWEFIPSLRSATVIVAFRQIARTRI